MLRHAWYGLRAGALFLVLILIGWQSVGRRSRAYVNPLRSWIDWSKTGHAHIVDVVAKGGFMVVSVAFVFGMIHWWGAAIGDNKDDNSPLSLGLQDEHAPKSAGQDGQPSPRGSVNG